MSQKGHDRKAQPPNLRVGCRFSNPTSAGPLGSYRIAPIPAVRGATIGRLKSTQSCPFGSRWWIVVGAIRTFDLDWTQRMEEQPCRDRHRFRETWVLGSLWDHGTRARRSPCVTRSYCTLRPSNRLTGAIGPE